MVVEAFTGERSDLVILLAVEDQQLTVVSAAETAEIRRVCLHIEGVECLCCGDVSYSETDVVETWVFIDHISKPILGTY